MATPIKNVENLPIASAVPPMYATEFAREPNNQIFGVARALTPSHEEAQNLPSIFPVEATRPFIGFRDGWWPLQNFINMTMYYGEFEDILSKDPEEAEAILKMQKNKVRNFLRTLEGIYRYEFNSVDMYDIKSIFEKLYERCMSGFFGERFIKIDRMHRRITFIIDEFGKFLANYVEKRNNRPLPLATSDEDNYSRGIANEEDNLEFKNFCNGLYDEALKVKGGNKTHKKRLFKKKYCKNKTCKKKYNKYCKKKYNKSCKRK
jgi:hypothetical protein